MAHRLFDHLDLRVLDLQAADAVCSRVLLEVGFPVRHDEPGHALSPFSPIQGMARSALIYRQHATFYTDAYPPYGRVIPETQHRTVTKEARHTNHLERFNGTLRQRLSRLVRSTLSFSKKLTHHIGAIRYLLCHYNLTRAARCKGQPISP